MARRPLSQAHSTRVPSSMAPGELGKLALVPSYWDLHSHRSKYPTTATGEPNFKELAAFMGRKLMRPVDVKVWSGHKLGARDSCTAMGSPGPTWAHIPLAFYQHHLRYRNATVLTVFGRHGS